MMIEGLFIKVAYDVDIHLGKVERFKKRIEEEVDIDLNNFVKIIEKRIGLFIASCKNNYLDLYESVDFPYYKDFFEVMDKYKVYQNIRS